MADAFSGEWIFLVYRRPAKLPPNVPSSPAPTSRGETLCDDKNPVATVERFRERTGTIRFLSLDDIGVQLEKLRCLEPIVKPEVLGQETDLGTPPGISDRLIQDPRTACRRGH